MLDLFFLTFLVIQTTIPMDLLLTMNLLKLLRYDITKAVFMWIFDRKCSKHPCEISVSNGCSKWRQSMDASRLSHAYDIVAKCPTHQDDIFPAIEHTRREFFVIILVFFLW